MNDCVNPKLARRDLLRVLAAGAGAAAVSTMAITAATAENFKELQKSKPHYRETDDVRAFYRVNRY